MNVICPVSGACAFWFEVHACLRVCLHVCLLAGCSQLVGSHASGVSVRLDVSLRLWMLCWFCRGCLFGFALQAGKVGFSWEGGKEQGTHSITF
jgi:hypothetical protein